MKILLPLWIILSAYPVYSIFNFDKEQWGTAIPFLVAITLGITLVASLILTFIVRKIVKFFSKSKPADVESETVVVKKTYTTSIALGLIFFLVGGVATGYYFSLQNNGSDYSGVSNLLTLVMVPAGGMISMFFGLIIGLIFDHYKQRTV
jgi:hypothetical protein